MTTTSPRPCSRLLTAWDRRQLREALAGFPAPRRPDTAPPDDAMPRPSGLYDREADSFGD